MGIGSHPMLTLTIAPMLRTPDESIATGAIIATCWRLCSYLPFASGHFFRFKFEEVEHEARERSRLLER